MTGMLAFFEEGTWLRDKGLPILITIAVAAVVTLVLHQVVKRFRDRLEAAPSASEAGNIQRAATLAHALSATITVLVWTTADPVLGRIEWFTLRATALRAYDGTLHVVPNGNIQVVSNKSRGWARAIIDTRFAYGQDPEQVRGLIDELFAEMREDPQLVEWVKDGPAVLGVETTSDTGVVIRAVAETLPSKRFDVERLLRERITQRLAERGIRGPLPSPTSPRPP